MSEGIYAGFDVPYVFDVPEPGMIRMVHNMEWKALHPLWYQLMDPILSGWLFCLKWKSSE